MRRNILTVAISIMVLSIALPSFASIIGLYYRGKNDKMSVYVKESRPFLKIEVQNFPDLPECPGFQMYRHTPHQKKLLNCWRTVKEKGPVSLSGNPELVLRQFGRFMLMKVVTQ